MTFDQTIAKLEALNAEISIFRNLYRYVEESARWQCNIEIKDFGEGKIELKASATGPNLNAAVLTAYSKVAAIIDSASFAVAFEIPLLTVEAKANPNEAPF